MKQYIILAALAVASLVAKAQEPINTLWHLEPNNKKGNSGIGLAEAQEMVKGKTATTVIVAIADAGVDIYHPDLKTMLWTNTGEIASNGIDDDENGYVDDINGWNFLGETTYDNMELTREYARLNAIYELKDIDQTENQEEYLRYQTLKEAYLNESQEAKFYFEIFEQVKVGMELLEKEYGSSPTKDQLVNHKSKSRSEQITTQILQGIIKDSKELDYAAVKEEMEGAYEQYDFMYNYGFNVAFNPRTEKVGDDYSNPNEQGYGNNKVYYGEEFSEHGTHVAGIVAADASNDFGTKGICQSCKIMSIRNVPQGDERDKDVANGIRYAVDNGAKIVNMSFGKSYAQNTEVVKEAIRYAESENVLLIHAAGNDGKNNDNSENYPNDFNGEFNNWIEVGASSWQKKPKALADFSNYGAAEVDLFAPGVAIYSATPENQYEAFDGTSMASPVVSGVAAFIWSYYPSLTAVELKKILLDSAVPIHGRNRIPGARKKHFYSRIPRTCVSEISKTGGQVNLPAALRLAEERTNK
jgi:subtilisin family serine protease